MKLKTIFSCFTILTLLTAATGLYYYYIAQKEAAYNEDHLVSISHSDSINHSLSQMISHYQGITLSLSRHHELNHLLTQPSPDNLKSANHILDLYNDSLQTNVCYLLNAEGITIASSNRNDERSFVRKNYSFRPYFKRAVEGKSSVYMAQGVTSEKRGIYFSHPVTDDFGSIVGVAVIKEDVKVIEDDIIDRHHLTNVKHKDYIFIVDENGVIFISDHPRMLLQTIWEVHQEVINRIGSSNQFGKGPWPWAGFKKTGRQKVIDQSGRKYSLIFSDVIKLYGWKLVHLSDLDAVSERVASSIFETAGYVVFFIAVVLVTVLLVLVFLAAKAERSIKDSKDQLQVIFDNAPVVMMLLNENSEVIKMNKAGHMIARKSNNKSAGFRGGDVLSCVGSFQNSKGCGFGEDCENCKIKKTIEQTFTAIQDFHKVEAQVKRKVDNAEVLTTVLISTAVVNMEPAKTVLITIDDITERKNIEAALSESEAKLSHIIMGSPVPTFVIDNNHVTTHWNKALEKVSGISSGQVVETKKQWMAFYSMKRPVMADLIIDKVSEEEIHKYYKGKYKKSGNIENAYEAEDFFPDMDIEGRWLFFTAAPLLNSSGETIGAVETLQDTTARKMTEEALREREKRYRSLANNLNVGVYRIIAGTKGKFIEANPAISEIFGFDSREAFFKISVGELYKNPKDRIMFNKKLIKRGSIKNEELELKKKDGTIFTGSVSAVVVKDDKGKVISYDGIIEDITTRKLMEKELKMSLKRFQALLQLNQMTEAKLPEITEFALEEAVRLTGSKIGYLAFLNDDESVLTIHSWSKSAMKECAITNKSSHYPVVDTGLWGEAVRQRKPVITNDYAATNPLKKGIPDGHISISRHMNAPIFNGDKIVAIAGVGNKKTKYSQTDVDQISLLMRGMWNLIERKQSETEREQLQTQLAQAQKMEAIGTLSGGIAHDFNNILSGIFGFSQLAKRHLNDPDRAENDIKQIIKGAQKATDLVQQILTVSRKSTHEKQPLSVHVVIKEAIKLLRATIPVTIEIKENIVSTATVLADPTQIHQIIMNLCTNAYHAMRGKKEGVLAVDLKEIEFSDKDSIPKMSMKPGKYLKLQVSDTGAGMDSVVMEKIFDPYFTTKDPGEGTGLGLAVVFGIVKEHQGHINVYSEPGQGSTFHVYLPVIEKVADPYILKKEKEVPISGTERILFVDDDEAVLNSSQVLLEELGYKVSSFLNGIRAFEIYEKDPHRFDLVITDMTMPGMSGLELAQKILKLRPDQPVVLCSGHSESTSREQAMAIGIKEYYEKPVITKEITKVIRKVLDGPKDALHS